MREDPPLVDLKVTNPITYIKKWWGKIIGNEGIDFRFRVHPLTALAIAIVIASIGFGVGRFILPFPIPFFQYNNETGQVDKVSPTANPWRETAYTGTLQFSKATSLYYLQVTSSSEAITLQTPSNIDFEPLIGKRILAIGSYNKGTRTLVVADAKDLEILPKSPIPIPTIEPTNTTAPTATQTPLSEPTNQPY